MSCAVCTKNETGNTFCRVVKNKELYFLDIADSANQTDFATVTNITGLNNCHFAIFYIIQMGLCLQDKTIAVPKIAR